MKKYFKLGTAGYFWQCARANPDINEAFEAYSNIKMNRKNMFFDTKTVFFLGKHKLKLKDYAETFS